MKKIMFFTLVMVLLTAFFVTSTDVIAISILGFGESGGEAVVTVSFNGESYWLSIGDEIDGYAFEGIVNKQLSFSKERNLYLVNVGGSISTPSETDETAAPGASRRFTGRDAGNAGPVNVPDNSIIKWSASAPDMDMEVAFSITTNILSDYLIANTNPPAEASYYFENGEENVVFDVNAYGGVDWSIEIIEQ